MRSSFRAASVAALALTLFVGACGDDDSGPNPSSKDAGLLVAGDFDTEDYGSESSNLLFALQDLGYPLDTTSATDSTHIAALIAGKEIVFFPEYTPTFDAGTQAILKAFVQGGGTLVLVGGYTHTDWVNTAFGWTLDSDDGWSDRAPMAKEAGASGTPYSGGPSSIPANDGTDGLDSGTLPDSAIIVYGGADGSPDPSVVILPSGSGRLVYMGWDWYDGKPYGIQDGGWLKLLKLSAGF
jgi:hypothetical protein